MLIDAVLRYTDADPGTLWAMLYLCWLVGSTLFLLLRRRRPVSTLAWLLAFWSLPVISAAGYFLFGPRRLDDQRLQRQTAKRMVKGAAPTLGEETSDEFDRKVRLSGLVRLTRALGDDDARPLRANAIALYECGNDAYPAIEQAIQDARETVHLEYFIWQPDGIGTRLRDLLRERARDGVQIRLVVDAIGAKDCNREFWQPLLDAGGRVRVFNPPRWLIPQPGRINFRTHRKIVVIDGKIAFTGGINIMDANRSTDNAPDPWRSTHLKIAGPPAQSLQTIFLEDWQYATPLDSASSSPSIADCNQSGPDPDHSGWYPSVEPADGAWVHIVDSGPDEPNNDIHEFYFAAIMSARQRLWITTPYFVPDEPIETALKSAAAQGVDVRLILPANSDSHMVQAAATTYAADAVQTGVKVWLYEPVMNHSKTMIIDDELGIVGTANLDNRSFRLNFEVIAAVFDRQFTNELASLFEKDLERCRVFDSSAAEASLPKNLYVNGMRLLSPLL